MARETSTKRNKCYEPSSDLIDLMVGLLNLEPERIKLEKEIGAGKVKGKEAIDEKKEILKRRKRQLDTMKVRVLDKDVFPSMANLVIFLEFMLTSPYLHKTFEKDLKSLFFAKSTVNKNMKNAYIFWRLVNALCSFDINKQDKETGKPVDRFKLILCDIMQESINESIFRIGPFVFNDILYRKTLGPDMERARAWTSTLAREAYDDLKFDKDRRPALF